MDLKASLINEMSRRQMDKIAAYIGDDETKFEVLWTLFRNEKPPIPHRAAWAIDIVTEERPQLITPYLDEIIENLENFEPSGVKREMTKIIARSVIPRKYWTHLIEICFDWIESIEMPVAVKVYCMSILANIALEEPDLQEELIMVIEEKMPEESAAFKARGRNIISKLKKQKLSKN